MSRDKLDSLTANRIEGQLPAVNELRKAALGLHPAFISMNYPVGSRVPIAAVCFHDATSTLEEVRYALFECLAHLWCYREYRKSPDDRIAAFYGRFYLDDAALRLYAAGEHLANAIDSMLEIDPNDLKRFKTKEGSSLQATVGRYLIAEKSGHPLTSAIVNLIDGTKWIEAINYRNEWVHSKPPILREAGIEFERTNRLQVWDDAVGISIGGGDEPKYSVDALVKVMTTAAFSLTEAVTTCLEYYFEYLAENDKAMFLTKAG